MPIVDVTGDGSKVCYKEQYSIGTWNVRFMNQDKLKVVKQEMAKEHKHSWDQRTKNGLEWVNLTQMTIYLLLWARIT